MSFSGGSHSFSRAPFSQGHAGDSSAFMIIKAHARNATDIHPWRVCWTFNVTKTDSISRGCVPKRYDKDKPILDPSRLQKRRESMIFSLASCRPLELAPTYVCAHYFVQGTKAKFSHQYDTQHPLSGIRHLEEPAGGLIPTSRRETWCCGKM